MVLLIALSVALFLALCFLGFLYASEKKKTREVTTRMAEMELKLNNIEMNTIQYKLNPHLFKNTFNSIQSHAYQTYYALDKLSNVLDYILYESDRKFVSLREEIEFVLSLVEVNRLKMSPLFDLRIRNNIEPQDLWYGQKLIAPLITVELVENAFKHADLQAPDAFISILFEIRNHHFVLTVANKISSADPLTKEKSGFGNSSLRTRLQSVYGKRFVLEQFAENNVYIAQLKINLLEYKAEVLGVGR